MLRHSRHLQYFITCKVHAVEQSHAVIIMEYVGSRCWLKPAPLNSACFCRNLHYLLVEKKEKSLGRSWLLGAAAQVLAGHL